MDWIVLHSVLYCHSNLFYVFTYWLFVEFSVEGVARSSLDDRKHPRKVSGPLGKTFFFGQMYVVVRRDWFR